MELHIANTFDKNRLGQYYVMLSSLFASNGMHRFHFHVVATGLEVEEEKELERYVTKNQSKIQYYRIDLEKVKDFPLGAGWTAAVYYRLFLFLALDKLVQRVLYLDTDTLVLKDLSSFFLMDMGRFPVAAVYDNYVKTRPELGLTKNGAYFNSGVMLINLPLWNAQTISERAVGYLKSYPRLIKFVDQDALNVVLADNWLEMSKNYNFMFSYVPSGSTSKQYKYMLTDIVIVHFTLERPWNLLCQNRYRSLYYRYHRLSPRAATSAITDFSLLKLGKFMRIRLSELYLDNPLWVRTSWKKIKGYLK